MKAAAAPLIVSFSLAGGVALAQDVPAGGSRWVISETSSPVDYSPVVLATINARGRADSASMQLNATCRSGLTELAVTGPAISGRGDDYVIAFRVGNNVPVQIPGTRPAFGAGAKLTGDSVRLLRSLPEQGDIAIRLVPRVGPAVEGVFPLDGLTVVRDKLAGACKWPQAIANPRN
jgi:hypothetical protein